VGLARFERLVKPLRFALLSLALLTMTLKAEAASYDVGPGKTLTSLFSVPWKTLQPGDVVNIYPKPGGYKEKIQVSASGTSAQHIVIRGIPDPATGALPILDANGAVEDPSTDWRNPVLSDFGMITVSPRKSVYVYGQPGVSFVDIETLDIRNAYYTADNSITYTDQTGAVRRWDGFACGVYVEWALDFTLRGCEISNCGNGFFANSKNGAVQSSARLLIEKNYFHDNSLPSTVDPVTGAVISNGYHEHHIYTESVGVTIQFNKFGRLHPGAHGCAIKDRSSGEVIRYNEFDMLEESNVLALLDPQGGSGYIEQQPHYLDSYVYGNLVTIENYASDTELFWWGAYNGSSQYPALHRGTLYFYHNTVVVHHGKVGLFFLPSTTYTGNSPTFESVDCRNNIFYVDSAIQSNSYNAMHWFTGGATNGGGNIDLGVNWVSPGTLKDAPFHAYGGALNGANNLIIGDAGGSNDPHFVDMIAHDYHGLPMANTIDVAGPLAPATLSAFAPTMEYLPPQSSKQRVQQGANADLGAVENGGSPTPSPTPARSLNLSTRGKVQTGDQVLIAGVVVTGNQPKKVLLRATGPSLATLGISNWLSDPALELHEADGTVIRNGDWKETQQAEIAATQLAPTNDKESAMIVTLAPGAHTAIVAGQNGETGTAVVEAYDLEGGTTAVLANISTRGLTQTGNDVLIGGFVLGGSAGSARVVVRGIGPSLSNAGIAQPLTDPVLSLMDANGAVVGSNNDWQSDPAAAAFLQANQLAPSNSAEAAIVSQLGPGAYTAILSDRLDRTGIGLIEIYNLR
jgi:hypothetical protein